MNPPIQAETWQMLVETSRSCTDWAKPGVFAPAVGPNYRPGAGLLYVGKSAGPLGNKVGSGLSLQDSMAASLQWMVTKQNHSAYWQFVDAIDSTRKSIAWTNVCKFDSKGGNAPSGRYWRAVCEPCLAALNDELLSLKPRVAAFTISKIYRDEVFELLSSLGYKDSPDLNPEDGHSSWLRAGKDSFAVLTRHPQGWAHDDGHNDLIDQITGLLV
jgi:hypothetical protein